MLALDKGRFHVLHKTKEHSKKMCCSCLWSALSSSKRVSAHKEKGPKEVTSSVSNSLALSLGWNVFTYTEGGAMYLWPLSVLKREPCCVPER